MSQKPHLQAAKKLAELLEKTVGEGEKTLLLLAGGSANDVYDAAAEFIVAKDLSKLMVIMGDERWDSNPAHADSDWKHFQDSRLYQLFKERNAITIDILSGDSLETETEKYNELLSKAKKNGYKIIAQLGIGSDGHTAGIIPSNKEDFERVFKTDKFAAFHHFDSKFNNRITITPAMIENIDYLLVYATGEAKLGVLKKLVSAKGLLDKNKVGFVYNEMPSLYLLKVKNAWVFTDQQLN